MMKFNIDSNGTQQITDKELLGILLQVFVAEGFTEPETANELFKPSAIRERGVLIAAREKQNSILAGIVIIVPADSSASRIAKGNEAEMHLLAVKQDYRRCGVGKMLVDEVLNRAKKTGYSKIILWTQTSMKAAQNLYESRGFDHIKDINRNGRDFLVYEKQL